MKSRRRNLWKEYIVRHIPEPYRERESIPFKISVHRRANLLSKSDMAFLLGLKSHTTIGRYERGVRAPTLEDALMYEFMFDTPIRVLFPSIAEAVEHALIARAKLLLVKYEKRTQTRRVLVVREVLQRVIANGFKRDQAEQGPIRPIA